MKKLPLLLLSASLLTGALLASCDASTTEGSSTEPDTSNIDSKEDSIASSEEETPVEPSSSEEVAKKYKLTYEKDSSHPGVTVAFHDGESADLTELTEAKEGQIVYVNVWDNETQGRSIFKAVLANGEALGHAEQGSFYKLVMPAEDVLITLEYNTSGEDTPSTSHSITYEEDSAHADAFVNVAIGDSNLNDFNIVELPTTAPAGETIYIYAGIESETETVSGALANGVACETYTFEGVELFKFTMPDADVVITLTYAATASSSHALNYVEDTAHPNTFVSFLGNIDDLESPDMIETAEAGATVYVMVSYDADTDTISGVFANGVKTSKSEDYDWMLSSFIMPDEDVTITVTYA